MYNTRAALEEKVFWWENHLLEMFLSALEKIIGSKQFVRWMMAALHKAHGWTPTKKSTFPLWHVSNTTCVPVPVEHCSYGPLKITSNLLHCFFWKFCWYFLLGALFRFLFGFDQPESINVTSNFLRFQSKLWKFLLISLSSTVCPDALQLFIKIRKPSYFIFTCLFFDSSRLFSVFLWAVPLVNT